jgi:hypothetical protein
MHKIIYYPGTYGSYLTFVLNQCLSQTEFDKTNLVSEFNTCHDAVWKMRETPADTDQFISWHTATVQDTEKFIVVDFDSNDDILVFQLLLQRAGNSNINTNEFEKNTYFKLIHHNEPYEGMSPMMIIDRINKFSDISPYYDIKDPGWPDIYSVDDFYNLPKHIIEECDHVFDFSPFCLSETRPDAPRWALRQMFKMWFADAETLPSDEIKYYSQRPNAYKLNLNTIYDLNAFKQELLKIGQYFDLNMNLTHFSTDVYDKVVANCTYKNTRSKCAQILDSVVNEISMPIDLNVFEEGYLVYQLEKQFDIIFPINKKHFFSNTSEIIKLKKHEL